MRNPALPSLAHGVGLAGRIPVLQSLLRWWARRYRDGSVVMIRSGYARGSRWRRDHRYVNGYWLGHYELPVQEAIARELREGDVFYDVGANAGFFALLGARRVGPSGLCVAFDPDPDNCRSMEGQAELNGLRNWVVVSEAVGAEPGRRSLLRSSPGASTNRLAAAAEVRAGSLAVHVTTVDLAAERFRPPTLVKVDVEGAEADVLRGAQRLLAEVRPTWLIELHGADPARAVHRRLHDAGYRLWTLDGQAVESPEEATHHVLGRPE